MTDITELAQRMKEHAGYIIDLLTHEPENEEAIIHAYDQADRIFSAENVLALVEALENAQQRNAKLESKLSNPVQLPHTNGYWTETEKAYEEAITLAKRQIRLAGFRCEGDE